MLKNTTPLIMLKNTKYHIFGIALLTITNTYATTVASSFTASSMSDNTEIILGTVDLSTISLSSIDIEYAGTALHSATNPIPLGGLELDMSYNFNHQIVISFYETGLHLFSSNSLDYEVTNSNFSVLPENTRQESFLDAQTYSSSNTGSYSIVEVRATIDQSFGPFGDPFVNSLDGVQNATFNLTFTGTSVPEPSSTVLLGVAALSLLNKRQRMDTA